MNENVKVNTLFEKTLESDNITISRGELIYSEIELGVSWHNEVEVIHILEGEGHYTIDGKIYRVRSGSFIIINPNQIHSATASIGRPLTFESLKFKYQTLIDNGNDIVSNDYIKPLFHGEKYLPNTILPTMPMHSMFSSMFYQLSEAYNQRSKAKYIILKSYIFHLLYLFYSNRYVYKKTISHKTSNAVDKVKEAITYIKDHYNETIDLDFMSVNLDTSKPHLCRVFKRHTNQTITEYMNDYRIKIAYDLLTQTNQPISEIAFDIGYVNVAYFNARFKKKTLLTPKQYRESYKKR